MPKISVIMALYNTPLEYLKPTVESILNQTFTDFEFIVVDDASTVDFSQFFKNYNDERIKYFKLEKNSGPGGARNEGIKIAQGEYIANADSDDVYIQNRLELQSDFLDKNPDISIISSAFKQSNNGKITPAIQDSEDIKVFMLFNSPMAAPTAMFRKKVFVEKNLEFPMHSVFAEDYQLWIEAMIAGVEMSNITDVLMIYTRRKNQLSKAKADKQISTLNSLYSKILNHMGISPSEKELKIHYSIYSNNFDSISKDDISNWFDKIIDKNKTVKLFDEKRLINKKNQTLGIFEKAKNRIFKLKIGKNNFCIYKPLKIALEKRD